MSLSERSGIWRRLPGGVSQGQEQAGSLRRLPLARRQKALRKRQEGRRNGISRNTVIRHRSTSTSACGVAVNRRRLSVVQRPSERSPPKFGRAERSVGRVRWSERCVHAVHQGGTSNCRMRHAMFKWWTRLVSTIPWFRASSGPVNT